MKGVYILLLCVGVLALVVFCSTLFALPSVTLYEAKYDAFSSDQTDPSIKKLVTTDDAAIIMPLMDEMGISFERIVQALEYGDPEYMQKMITKFEGQYTNLKKSSKSLPKSLLNVYIQAADSVKSSSTILSKDYSRAVALVNELEFSGTERPDLLAGNFDNVVLLNTEHNREILMELGMLGSEMKNSLTNLQKASQSMANVAGAFGRSTTELISITKHLDDMAETFSMVFDDRLWQSITDISLSYTISPESGKYGDTITFSGSTLPSVPITSYIDGAVWGTGKANSYGLFTLKVKVGQHHAGEHTVAMSDTHSVGKTMPFQVLPQDTVLNIGSVTQIVAEDGGYLVNISGDLRTTNAVTVVNATVDVVDADYGLVLGSGLTTGTGTWTASIPMNEGSYTVYAVFKDSSFPLTESQSEPEIIHVGPQYLGYYYVILIVVLVAGGILLWRIVYKRKSHVFDDTDSEEPVDHPVTLKSIAKCAVEQEEEDEFVGIEPDVLLPVQPYPAGLDAIEDLREVYRCVIHAVAANCTIERVDALTPFEAVKESGISELMPFIERYVYLRYGTFSVSVADLKEMKTMAKNLERTIRTRDES